MQSIPFSYDPCYTVALISDGGFKRMSSWGYRTFEDDIACDWFEDLYDSDPIAFFVKCLDLEGRDDLDFLACIGVVCTAEILCGVTKQPRIGIPDRAVRWCVEHRDLRCRYLIPRAIKGMKLVLADRSEMWVRWEDDEERFNDWKKHQQELLQCLEDPFSDST